MGVTIRKKKLKDGSFALRLDIYHNGVRKVESLKNLRLVVPKSPHDRQQNKIVMQTARSIALKMAEQLEARNYNVVSLSNSDTYVCKWMQDYINEYQKRDKRNLQGALNKFKKYLKGKDILFKAFDVVVVEGYMNYLESVCTGEGAPSYFRRFSKMVKSAIKRRIIIVNPITLTEKKIRGKAGKKDVLSIDEIRLLIKTPISNLNVRNAAIFCTQTGLAWIDVKNLTWANVKNDRLELIRSKLIAENETITIPLSQTALSLLPEKNGKHVFELPTADGANKVLKGWVKSAGIEKKITWHNLRHSFGTNLIANGNDILTTSRLLGHSSTKHTHRYVRASEEMQLNAIKSIEL
jgi:integrase